MGGGTSALTHFHNELLAHEVDEEHRDHLINHFHFLHSSGAKEEEIRHEIKQKLQERQSQKLDSPIQRQRSASLDTNQVSTSVEDSRNTVVPKANMELENSESTPALKPLERQATVKGRRSSRDGLTPMKVEPSFKARRGSADGIKKLMNGGGGERKASLRGNEQFPAMSSKAPESVIKNGRGQSTKVVSKDAPFFCQYCQTGFQTSAQLEKHVKLSAVHAKAVKAAEIAALAPGSPAKLSLDQLNSGEDADASVDRPPAPLKPMASFRQSSIPTPSSPGGIISRTTTDGVVTESFLCDICASSFKTQIQLDRHVQFSDRHQQNLAKQQQDKVLVGRAQRIAQLSHGYIDALKGFAKRSAEEFAGKSMAYQRWKKAVRRVIAENAINRTEKMLLEIYRRGEQNKQEYSTAKLIFKGSKLFWRTQETLDVQVFCHDDEDTRKQVPGGSAVLEIVGSFLDKDCDLRLHIRYSAVTNLAQVQAELKEANEKFKKMENGQSKYEKAANSIICGFIVDRLTIENVVGFAMKKRLSLTYDQTGIAPEEELILDSSTLTLKPVKVTLTRRRSIVEIHSALAAMSEHSAALASSTAAAESHVAAVASIGEGGGGGGGRALMGGMLSSAVRQHKNQILQQSPIIKSN